MCSLVYRYILLFHQPLLERFFLLSFELLWYPCCKLVDCVEISYHSYHFFFLTAVMLLYSGCLQDLFSSLCFHPFDCDVFVCDFLSNYSAWNLLSFFEYVSLCFSQNLEKFWPLSDIFLSHYLQLYITRPLVIVL